MIKLDRFTIDTRYVTGPKIIFDSNHEDEKKNVGGGLDVRFHYDVSTVGTTSSTNECDNESSGSSTTHATIKILKHKPKYLIHPPDTLLDNYIVIIPGQR